MNTTVTYRCPKKCPIRKNCFVIKVSRPLQKPLEVLKKCPAADGNDITIVIGEGNKNL